MTADGKIARACDKAPMYMIPFHWLKGVCRVFAHGAVKYGRENYYQGDNDPDTGDRYVGGILRHLGEMQTPGGAFTMQSMAALDKDSGLPHIDHMICGALMLRARMVKAGALTEDPIVPKVEAQLVLPVINEVPVIKEVIPFIHPMKWHAVRAEAVLAGRKAYYFKSYGHAEHAACQLNEYPNNKHVSYKAERDMSQEWAVVQ